MEINVNVTKLKISHKVLAKSKISSKQQKFSTSEIDNLAPACCFVMSTEQGTINTKKPSQLMCQN